MLKSIKKGLSELLILGLLSNPISYAFAGNKINKPQQEASVHQPINKRLTESKKKDLENILATIKKYEVSIFSGAATFSYNDGQFKLKLTPPYKIPNKQDNAVSFNYQFKNLYNSFHNLIVDGEEVEKKFDKWFFSALYSYLGSETKRKMPKQLVHSNTCRTMNYDPLEMLAGIYFLKDKKTNESCGFIVLSQDIANYAGRNPNTFFSDYNKVLGDPYKSDRAYEAIFRPGSTIIFNALPLIDLISRQKLEEIIKTQPSPPKAPEKAPEPLPQKAVPLPKKIENEYVQKNTPPTIVAIAPDKKCPKENEIIKYRVNVLDEERNSLYGNFSLSIGQLNQAGNFIGTPETYEFEPDPAYVVFPEGYKEMSVLFKSKSPLKKISNLDSDISLNAYFEEADNSTNYVSRNIIYNNPFKECLEEKTKQQEQQKEPETKEKPKPGVHIETEYIPVEEPSKRPAEPAPVKEEQPAPALPSEPLPKQKQIPVIQQKEIPKPSQAPESKKGKEPAEKSNEVPIKKPYKETHKPYFSHLEVSGILKNIYERYSQPVGLDASSAINLNLFGTEISESARLGRFYEKAGFRYLDGNKAKLQGKTKNPQSTINGSFNAIEKNFDAAVGLLAYDSNNIIIAPGIAYELVESRIDGDAALDIGGETSLDNKTTDTIYSAGIDAQFKGKIGYGIGFGSSYRKQNNRIGLDLEGPVYNIKLNSNIDLGKLYVSLDGSYERANMKFSDFKRIDNTFDVNTSVSYNLGNHLAIGLKYNYVNGNSNQKYNNQMQFKTKTKENAGGIFFRIE